jgi:protein TonB
MITTASTPVRKFCRFSSAIKAATSLVALLAGCSSTPLPPLQPLPPVTAGPGVNQSPGATSLPAQPALVSLAKTAREYRKDAAAHLYEKNQDRIYQGKLPPLLYAIGVLQVDVDGRGRVTHINWMRAPKHAPEVVAEIERTVRQAAPYPVPARMGRVTYTDTWLWHRSGTFQLDTLTEGQY